MSKKLSKRLLFSAIAIAVYGSLHAPSAQAIATKSAMKREVLKTLTSLCGSADRLAPALSETLQDTCGNDDIKLQAMISTVLAVSMAKFHAYSTDLEITKVLSDFKVPASVKKMTGQEFIDTLHESQIEI